jgi:hypothetical protein
MGKKKMRKKMGCRRRGKKWYGNRVFIAIKRTSVRPKTKGSK